MAMAIGNRAVLIVDDDPDIREALRDILGDEGYETAAATDGQAALDYLRSHPAPGVVLLDWNMAPMGGRQFMEEAAKDPEISRIPVVLLTADAKAAETFKSAAFVEYLRKPVDLEALFGIVGRYCSRATVGSDPDAVARA
jgi:CheY-like chemotaxis protein